MIEQAEFFPPSSPVPPGNTPSWFTDASWFLETERRLLESGRLTGLLELDPCGHEEAPVSRLIEARGGRVYTRERDGLREPWGDRRRVFVNPPYDAASIDRWLARLCEALATSEVIEAVALVPAWTDRVWWHDHVEPSRLSGRAHVEFIKGRLNFGWPGHPTPGPVGAMFANAVVVWAAS